MGAEEALLERFAVLGDVEALDLMLVRDTD
jgi:hypothetical protein